MANNKLTRLKAIKGTAHFCHLLKTEIYDEKDTNKYSVMLEITEEQKKDIEAKINPIWEDFASALKAEGKKIKFDPVVPFKEYNDKLFIKATRTASFENKKTKETVHVTVPIYDASCKEIRGKLKQEIGNGSTIKVSVDVVPFFITDRNYGIALRLVGVQVLELKTWGDSAESAGFEAEEGYEYEDTAEGFTSEEGDF